MSSEKVPDKQTNPIISLAVEFVIELVKVNDLLDVAVNVSV